MGRYDEPTGPGIGATLKDARRRIGMDIKEAEERTKIRTRYLRALEAEDWEVLPAPAYVRGFLRVYGQILGLDGEMLADRYRRSYEEPAAAQSRAAEPVLGNRRGPGRASSRPPSRSGWIVVVGAVIVVLLVVLAILGLTSGGSDERTGAGKNAALSKTESAKPDAGGERSGGLEPVDLSIEPLSSVRICLVGGSRDALVDSQVLTEGAVEEFSGEKTYRLDLAGGGTVRLTVGADEQKLKASDDASFQADANGISEISYAGPNCP